MSVPVSRSTLEGWGEEEKGEKGPALRLLPFHVTADGGCGLLDSDPSGAGLHGRPNSTHSSARIRLPT
jgi:hypothetical protein